MAVFASGNGSNALNFFSYFKNHKKIVFDRIYCNNPKAGIIQKAHDVGIDCRLFNREEWLNGNITAELKERNTDYIVLAGFLWLVPADLVQAFPNQIINIHPALLPLYGGKGMYGMRVHEQVVANAEKETGITIHLVNEEYDKGEPLFQKKFALEPGDTAESVAQKIHHLEYKYFPGVVEKYILGR